MDQANFTFCVNSEYDPFAEDCNIDEQEAAEGDGTNTVMKIHTINTNMDRSMRKRNRNISTNAKNLNGKKDSCISIILTTKLTLRQQISDLLKVCASVNSKNKHFDFKQDLCSNRCLNIRNGADLSLNKSQDDFITMKQIPKLD